MTDGGDAPGWREAGTDPAMVRADRLKRLKIRCWRRGTKEMDLILGRFVDAEGASLGDADLDALEALIREDDATLYAWVSGAAPAPAAHAALVARLAAGAAKQG